jgi:hypothetical protein
MGTPPVRPSTPKQSRAAPAPRRETDRPSGWDRYLELLVRERVPANARRR